MNLYNFAHAGHDNLQCSNTCDLVVKQNVFAPCSFNCNSSFNVNAHVNTGESSGSKVDVHADLSNFTHTFYNDNLDVSCTSLFLPDFEVDFRQVPAEIGGRLSYFAKNYEKLTSNSFLLNVIEHGYQIKFINDQPPPLSSHAKPFYLPLSEFEQQVLDTEMQTFLDQRVIEECDPATPGFYSPVFLREKRPDNDSDVNAPRKFRVIHDLSLLNKSIVKYKFKMDSASTVRLGLKQGMYFYSLDVKSAYNHVLIHPSSRKYLRCWWKGKAYCFRALPFGLSSAPWIFTSVMAITAKYLHAHAVYSFFYLDDVCPFHVLCEKLKNEQPLVILFFQMAGWVLNLPKSHLDVVQRGVYIGIDIDLYYGLVFPTRKRWITLQSIIQLFMDRDYMTARVWARLLGVITCLQDLTTLGRLQARTLQFHVNSYWRDRTRLYTKIPVLPSVKKALQWWTIPANVMSGTPLQPRPTTETLITDSSCHGYGAIWRTQELAGQWTVQESQLHINCLEALCIKKALLHWQQELQGQSVLVQTDSSTVVSHINRGSGCHSITTHLIIRDMLLWCHHHGITLHARHLPGKFNQIADLLSRRNQVIPTEWMIHKSVMAAIINTWEKPHIDLFATRLNAQLPIFMSPVVDTMALAVDALSQSWKGITGYAFPPFALIPKVLNKIQSEECIIYLIAPCWPRQSHFPMILDLLVDYPRKIPDRPDLLRMPRSPLYHQNPTCFNLHVFKLSSMVSERDIFLRKLQQQSVLNTETLPVNCMRSTGAISYIGVNTWGYKVPSMLLYQI